MIYVEVKMVDRDEAGKLTREQSEVHQCQTQADAKDAALRAVASIWPEKTNEKS